MTRAASPSLPQSDEARDAAVNRSVRRTRRSLLALAVLGALLLVRAALVGSPVPEGEIGVTFAVLLGLEMVALLWLAPVPTREVELVLPGRKHETALRGATARGVRQVRLVDITAIWAVRLTGRGGSVTYVGVRQRAGRGLWLHSRLRGAGAAFPLVRAAAARPAVRAGRRTRMVLGVGPLGNRARWLGRRVLGLLGYLAWVLLILILTTTAAIGLTGVVSG